MIEANKHIFVKHLLDTMRLIYAVFILLLALMTSAQCQQTAKDWFNKGVALDNQGNYYDATKAYDEAIRIDSNYVNAWINKGDALENQIKYDDAIQAYDEAIRLDPNYAKAWIGKGRVLHFQDKYDESIQSYDKAIELITQGQNTPISTAIKRLNNAASENNMIKILGIDSTAFPKIKANILIDKFCAMSGNLKKDDFNVKEDDNDVAIDNVYFSGNASGQKLDLAIVFDETTSMDAKIDALKSKVKDLTQKINSSKLDARYSLVTFNGADVTTKINWTNDAGSFRNIIGKLSTSGGNTDLPENSLDGIERVLSFGFRPDAQKVIIVVTDEPSQQKGDGKSNSAYTMENVKSDLLNSSSMLIAVSPDFRNSNVDPSVPRSNLPKYADMRILANEASGLWIDMNSADFSTILKQIQGILTGTYMIQYTSPDQTPSENRTVLISVDTPGCVVGSASIYHISPGIVTTFNDSDLAMAWHYKGRAFTSKGKYDEAIKAFEEANRLDPNDRSSMVCKLLLLRNRPDGVNPPEWTMQRKYDEAVKALDEAAKLDPNNFSTWMSKGDALALGGDYDEAIKAYDEVIRLKPEFSWARVKKGDCLFSQGKYDEATKVYDEAMRIEPDNEYIWYNKGIALKSLGRVTEADTAFAKAKELGYIG